MAVVAIGWAPSREAYEVVDNEVGRIVPPGLIVHAASEVNGKVRIVEVWDSQQHLDGSFKASSPRCFRS